MRYQFDDIETFLAVMEMGSMSAAATRLNLAKSVVSKRISHLEKTLGTALLQRTTHGITPTDEGQLFYARGNSILQQLDDAVEEVNNADGVFTGSLRISAPMSFGILYLGELLAPFLRQHPQLDVDIMLNDRKVDIINGNFDLVIRIAHLPDSSLIARKLCVSDRIVCASPDYIARHGMPQTLEDIQQHGCIGYSHIHSAQSWQFEAQKPGGKPQSITVRSRISADNGDIIRDLAIAGLGLSASPLFIVADALADGRLINAFPHRTMTPIPIHAVYTQARRSSKKLQALVEHLQRQLAHGAPWNQPAFSNREHEVPK